MPGDWGVGMDKIQQLGGKNLPVGARVSGSRALRSLGRLLIFYLSCPAAGMVAAHLPPASSCTLIHDLSSSRTSSSMGARDRSCKTTSWTRTALRCQGQGDYGLTPRRYASTSGNSCSRKRLHPLAWQS